MNNRDIVKFAMIKNMPGILDESARLHVGVKTGDAGVMGELLQAACDPSAGQQALQAGEAVQQPCLAEERRFELKRKADGYELELAERQLEVTDRQLEQKRKSWFHALEVEEQRLKLPLAIKKLQLEHVDHFFESLSRLNPAWRADARLSVQAQDLLCNVFALEPPLAATQGAAAAGGGAAGAAPGATVGPKQRSSDNVWRGKHCLHGKRAYRCKQCHA